MSFIINPYAFGAPASTLLTGLVEWWPLDESSGTRAGVHAGKDLTDVNTVTGAAGLSGSLASQFTHSNAEYLKRTSEAALEITGDMTVAAWVYRDGGGFSGPTIASKYEAVSQTSWMLSYDDFSGRFRFYAASGSGAAGQTTVPANTYGAPSTGNWILVIATHDATAGQIGICVNAGTLDTAAYAGGLYGGTADFRIGNWQHSSDRQWGGRLQQVGLWNRVLTSGERGELFNGGAYRAYPFV